MNVQIFIYKIYNERTSNSNKFYDNLIIEISIIKIQNSFTRLEMSRVQKITYLHS